MGAEETRRRILDAAFIEFSNHGFAGARMDRIAQTAECNKNLLYVYFDSKQKLYQTVLAQTLGDIFGSMQVPTEGLPEYAGRLFDFAMEHPDLVRLLAWATPEFAATPDDLRSAGGPIDTLTKLQASGTVSSRFPPDFLLASMLALATCWTTAFPFGKAIQPGSAIPVETIRAGVVHSVALILGDGVDDAVE